MLSLFSHAGAFTPVHANPSFCSTARPTLCVARSFNIEAMLHYTATPQAQLGRRKRGSPPHSRDRPLSTSVNLRYTRYLAVNTTKSSRCAVGGAVADSGMASEANYAARCSQSRLPAQIQKRRAPSLTFAQGSNGTPRATAPRGRQAGASIKTRRRIHECNGLYACAYPPQDPQRARSRREMAAPAIAVERFRVEHGERRLHHARRVAH
jgi:hypothetical protein